LPQSDCVNRHVELPSQFRCIVERDMARVAQGALFKSGADMVALTVTVTDSAGQ